MLTNLIYLTLAILAGTAVYVIVRTFLFQRSHGAVEPIAGMPVDADTVAQHLAAAIRCATVPRDEQGTPDPEAFQQLHQMLAETYPLVHQKLKREVISGYSLLYTWQGSRADLEPVMLMAHQDVVSADPDGWTHPPFAGDNVAGFIWGRAPWTLKINSSASWKRPKPSCSKATARSAPSSLAWVTMKKRAGCMEPG